MNCGAMLNAYPDSMGGRLADLAQLLGTEEFRDAYRIVEDSPALTAEQQALVLGRCREKSGGTLLISRKDADAFPDRELRTADLETIIVHLEKGVAL